MENAYDTLSEKIQKCVLEMIAIMFKCMYLKNIRYIGQWK